MSLLVPLALWGLLALPLILLLHLLRHRRTPLPISSLRLWQGLEQKRQGTLPRRLPLSLLLVLQLLIATALALALAQPALSFLVAPARQVVFILDTTTSMLAEDATLPAVSGSARRFEAARRWLQQQFEAMSPTDTFALISLTPRPQILLTGSGADKAAAALALDQLTAGATGHNLPAALTLADSLLTTAATHAPEIIILTDGSFSPPAAPLPPVSAPVHWQLFPAAPVDTANQALLNVSAHTLPDGRHRLFARLINYGETRVTRTLRVWADDQMTAEQSVTLDPQAEAARIWTLPAPAQTARIDIVEPDALPLDNRAEVWLTGVAPIRVWLFSDAPDLLARALSVQPGVQLTVVALASPIPAAADFDLLVFDRLPPALTAWPAGNVLVVNPTPGHPLLTAADLSGRNLRPNLKSGSSLLAGVDLSGVYFRQVAQWTPPPWAQVDLTALNETEAAGLPLIFSGTDHQARLVVWAFDLARSNLPGRLALPLLTANTLSYFFSSPLPPVVPVGEPVNLPPGAAVELPGGRQVSGDVSERGLFAGAKQPGLYQVFGPNHTRRGWFAVQAGSALESNLAGAGQLPDFALTTHPAAATAPETAYQEFWPWLAAVALGLLLLEGGLAWRK